MPRGVPSSVSLLVQTNGTNPAANAEISETVPVGKFWELLVVSVALVQGITQTPQPILTIDDGADILFELPGSTAAQAASTTCRYSWVSGHGAPTGQIGTGANIRSVGHLPVGLTLGPGYRVRTTTLGIGANTDYGAPSLFYVEYG